MQICSGITLWIGWAESEEAAITAMAHERGYRNIRDLPLSLKGAEFFVTPLDDSGALSAVQPQASLDS